MLQVDSLLQLHYAMSMRPSGSVEQLHAPSYGSRTGSSLSLASKGRTVYARPGV